MFYSCKSLKEFPNFCKLNIKNVNNTTDMFTKTSLRFFVDTKIREIVKLNQMKIKYNKKKIDPKDYVNISGQEYIRIFGYEFEKKNQKKCSIFFNGFEKELDSLLELYHFEYVDILEIILIENEPVTNMSEMFMWCKTLISVDFSQWDTKYVTDMSKMFSWCESLECVSNISNLNTKNVTNINSMFEYCKSLKSLPDISKWNTKNVIDMNKMFFRCDSLEHLPDRSKWKTKKADIHSYANNETIKNYLSKGIQNDITIIYKIEKESEYIRFFGDEFVQNNRNICKLLIHGKVKELYATEENEKFNKNAYTLKIYLIAIEPIRNMSCMFKNGTQLKSLPDINELNTKNVKSMSYLFSGCKSLVYLPDISGWNLRNVNDISYMFNGCRSLKSLPDISRWKLSNVNNMEGMFKDCVSLKSLPDISEWDTKNVINMNYLFYNCKSLNALQLISNWVIQEETSMNAIFLYSSFSRSSSIFKSLFSGDHQTLFSRDYQNRIIYKIGKTDEKIKIFGEEFVINNKNNCYLLIDGQKNNLYTELKLNSKQKENNRFFIILVETKPITNLNSMFYECKNLISLPDFKDWGTKDKYFTDMGMQFIKRIT